MSNPSKAKGTAGETAVLRYVQAHGFPWAERLTLSGNHDRGDISLLPGRAVVLEVKAHAAASTGQPAAGQLSDWMAQAETERVNAGADYCPLVVRRKGTTDVGRWFAFISPSDFASLVDAQVDLSELTTPLCTDVAAVLRLLRRAGYGSELEVAS